MTSLIEKLNQVAPSYGFKVYGPIPATPKEDLVNFDTALKSIIDFNATDYLSVVPELSLFKGKSL